MTILFLFTIGYRIWKRRWGDLKRMAAWRKRRKKKGIWKRCQQVASYKIWVTPLRTFHTPSLLIASISPKGNLTWFSSFEPCVYSLLFVWSILNSKSHPEAWTFVCVNNPEFNDIAREVYQKKVQLKTHGHWVGTYAFMLMIDVELQLCQFQSRPGRLGCQSI